MAVEMGELEFSTPKAAWGGEAAAFTPALAQRLAYLGDVCGLGPLELVDTEVATGARRIDVLATAEQRSVVIENQYGAADHDHLTRGLAYAVAQGAVALVVIAERHTDEFVAVADYLNRLAGFSPADEPAVSVWLVEVEAVRRQGDHVWSPLFTVRSRPNEWARDVKRATKSHSVTDMEEVFAATPDAETARWIVETWSAELHTSVAIGGGAKATVQLRHPDPADPKRGHALVTIQPRYLWVNVTFILDSSGAFSEEEDRVRFEQMVRTFPEASARKETLPAYFCIAYDEIRRRRQQFTEFVTWLLRHMDEKIGAA
jgi:hypothetical protein